TTGERSGCFPPHRGALDASAVWGHHPYRPQRPTRPTRHHPRNTPLKTGRGPSRARHTRDMRPNCPLLSTVIAFFVFRRPQDHLLGPVTKLAEIVTGHMLELSEQAAGLGPFAVLCELRADDGLEAMVPKVCGQPVLLEASRGLDRVRQHLPGGVSKRRKLVAQGVDAGGKRLRLVSPDKRLG